MWARPVGTCYPEAAAPRRRGGPRRSLGPRSRPREPGCLGDPRTRPLAAGTGTAGEAHHWGSAGFCLGTVSFPLAPARCFGSGHREATVARRHSLTEVSLSPPRTWPGACNAVPFGGMHPNPRVPLRSSCPVPTSFLPACGDLEALAALNYFLAHSVLSSPEPQLTANH